jgi:DNA repair exonuclease SbcCD ATPase subunit
VATADLAVSGQAQAAEYNQEGTMSGRESDALREHVDTLQKQVTHLKEAAEQARQENSEQVKARIQRAKTDMAAHHESAGEKAGQAAEGAQSQWQSMRADAQAKMRGLQDRVGRKRDELDAKTAEHDAEDAEGNAVDALDFAWWAAEEAEVAVLDAIDARAWADERAAASRTS